MTHQLITNEALEAAAFQSVVGRAREDYERNEACEIIQRFIAHHEGERSCVCVDDPAWMNVNTCPDCNGTGKVREDKLVKLSEVKFPPGLREFYEETRSEVIAEVLEVLRNAPYLGTTSGVIMEPDAHDYAAYIERELGRTLAGCPRGTPGCNKTDCSPALGHSCYGPNAPQHIDMGS